MMTSRLPAISRDVTEREVGREVEVFAGCEGKLSGDSIEDLSPG
jgi:hypothetical protein